MGVFSIIFGTAISHDAAQTTVEDGITEIMRSNPQMPKYGEGQSWEGERPSWQTYDWGLYDASNPPATMDESLYD
jgi:hypothetical protein